jgi:hypothetical protein
MSISRDFSFGPGKQLITALFISPALFIVIDCENMELTLRKLILYATFIEDLQRIILPSE